MILAALLLLLPSGEARDLDVQVEVLGAETSFATEVITVTSDAPGPTVMIVGGLHGNEPAGARAARQIAGWRLKRGTLVVVPRANVQALAAGTRRTPDTPKAYSDLNRQFPSEAPPRTAFAQILWDKTLEVQPDLLLDLHEGYDFHRRNADSVGSTVIATVPARDLADEMVTAINGTIDDPSRRYQRLNTPIEGSLARCAIEKQGIPAMIVETTTKDQSVAFRARQHRLLVYTALEQLAMVDGGPDVMVGSAGDDGDLAVAMYWSAGVSGAGPGRLEELLTDEAGFDLRQVCATDVRAGVLSQFDVVIFPGGSGFRQAKELREEGRAAVQQYVREGGGYVGFCAGAYLASTGYDWSLGILDAVVIDREHWARGKGDAEIAWTPEARTQLSLARLRATVRYANGPLYAPAKRNDLEDYTVIARYRSEINKVGAPEGVMLGSPAIVRGEFGEGVVLGVSPHPEQTGGMEDLTRRLIRLAGSR